MRGLTLFEEVRGGNGRKGWRGTGWYVKKNNKKYFLRVRIFIYAKSVF